MKDIITVAVVTFNAVWGEKERNLNRILGYIEAAAKRGCDLIALPEMALTGYDDEPETPKAQKMQTLLAETIPGPASRAIAELTKKTGIYALVGMPERDPLDSGKIYNSAAIFSPEGLDGAYRKIHLPAPEPGWAVPGGKPYIIDTPWGGVGVGICYDTYTFPELIRYYGAKGCRLYVNCTAHARCHGEFAYRTSLEAHVIQNSIYIASANLGGNERYNEFRGASAIIGPGWRKRSPHYYAGYRIDHESAAESEMFVATIDLSLAKLNIFKENPELGRPDFRADVYAGLYKDILNG